MSENLKLGRLIPTIVVSLLLGAFALRGICRWQP